ncbi:CapA family protein [Halobellus captivus]|uniref:CapA family protein n=1 Tax=Halobellus captivus TaxID=2592614 RepID=UPI001396B09C|nr:CapA family protein [Halobellus captivus]
MTDSIAISGDSIINRRLSSLNDPGLNDIAEIFRSADVGFTHFETLIHDYNDDGVYAAAEAGGTWMRSPSFVVEELQWLGIDVVSHASNHALDYGYGALRRTWDAFDSADFPIAGTGEDLSEAREPVFLDTNIGRVALVSMTTSFAPWSRAGAARYDHRGRPGLNPLGFHHAVDKPTLERIKSLAEQLGLWITELRDGEWALHPPGLHNTLTKFYESDHKKPQMIADERDREGNLRAIRSAARQADFVITHLHTHAWDPDGGLADPPAFVQQFARDCIDAGTDLFVGQGSHVLRPIEIYDGKPIFYDPGDLIMTNNTVDRLPMEFYERFPHTLDVDPHLASPSDGQAARPTAYKRAISPPDGYLGPPFGRRPVVPVCEFTDEGRVQTITLHPARLQDEPISHSGIPTKPSVAEAEAIIEYISTISEPFGTNVCFEDGTGVINA